jgi:hypothetical protein
MAIAQPRTGIGGLITFLMLVVSCSGLLKKKEEDAGLEASVTADTTDAAPVQAADTAAVATNQGDVARFPDETKLADVPATLQRGYNVREAQPAGAVITALPKGTAVTQIAQRGGSYLITFDNPKAPGTKLMGWIYKDAFNAVVADAFFGGMPSHTSPGRMMLPPPTPRRPPTKPAIPPSEPPAVSVLGVSRRSIGFSLFFGL